MSKNVKRIVAMALAIGTISAAAPATNLNFFTTKAYAASSDADELDSIDLQNDDGDSIDLYKDSDYEDEADDLDVGDTYYAESDTDSVTIDDIDGASKNKVRIFVGSDSYEVGDSISIDDGTTTLKVRVYEDDYDEDKSYSSSDYNEYRIKVEYNEDEDDDDDDDSSDDGDNDEDTLSKLDLKDKSGSAIQLYSDSSYKDKVDNDDVDEGKTYYAQTSASVVKVDTSGPKDKYVRVFKSTSDSSKGVETGEEISVGEDKTLTVKIYDSEPDDDVEYGDSDNVIGKYKIKLHYTSSGSSTGTSTGTTTTASSNPNSASDVTTVKNKWVIVNGQWQYKDAAGNTVKNSWIQNYFVKPDGNMATGWLSFGGKWYYLGSDGAKKTSWQKVNGIWYYLDTQGVMQVGWIKDITGKYYYLNNDGSMAYNTTVGGYRLGADGAWTGR